MASEQRGYHSYLLRLWQAGDGYAPEWRIVLEDARTHARQSFASKVSRVQSSLRCESSLHITTSSLHRRALLWHAPNRPMTMRMRRSIVLETTETSGRKRYESG